MAPHLQLQPVTGHSVWSLQDQLDVGTHASWSHTLARPSFVLLKLKDYKCSFVTRRHAELVLTLAVASE